MLYSSHFVLLKIENFYITLNYLIQVCKVSQVNTSPCVVTWLCVVQNQLNMQNFFLFSFQTPKTNNEVFTCMITVYQLLHYQTWNLFVPLSLSDPQFINVASHFLQYYLHFSRYPHVSSSVPEYGPVQSFRVSLLLQSCPKSRHA